MLSPAQKEQFAEALQRLAGDEQMLTMLAEIAADDAPGLLRRLADELRAGEVASAASTAHALKGLLSTFQTRYPITELQILIEAARDGDLNSARHSFESIEPALQMLIDQVSRLNESV